LKWRLYLIRHLRELVEMMRLPVLLRKKLRETMTLRKDLRPTEQTTGEMRLRRTGLNPLGSGRLMLPNQMGEILSSHKGGPLITAEVVAISSNLEDSLDLSIPGEEDLTGVTLLMEEMEGVMEAIRDLTVEEVVEVDLTIMDMEISVGLTGVEAMEEASSLETEAGDTNSSLDLMAEGEGLDVISC
jgi:hypothetical protein